MCPDRTSQKTHSDTGVCLCQTHSDTESQKTHSAANVALFATITHYTGAVSDLKLDTAFSKMKTMSASAV